MLSALANVPGSVSFAAERPFEFREGVVVDPRSETAFIMNEDDGVDAIRLRDARRRWTSDTAQKPLLLSGGLLVAQAAPGGRKGRLEIVWLDAGSGAPRGRATVALPESVAADIDEGAGTRFLVHAIAAPGGCILDWSYEIRPVQVLRHVPPPDSAARRWSGRARLWLADGRAGVPDAEDRPETLPLPLIAQRDAGRLPGPIWTCPEVWLSAGLDGPRSVDVERWRRPDGRALPRLRIPIEPGFTLRYPSADGRHLLLSRPVNRPAAEGGRSYLWDVHSLSSGRTVARFERDFPAAWFFIAGPLLIHEVQPVARNENGSWSFEPKKIRAIELRTGSERWSVPLRDTIFRGLSPPGDPSTPVEMPGGLRGGSERTPHLERGEP